MSFLKKVFGLENNPFSTPFKGLDEERITKLMEHNKDILIPEVILEAFRASSITFNVVYKHWWIASSPRGEWQPVAIVNGLRKEIMNEYREDLVSEREDTKNLVIFPLELFKESFTYPNWINKAIKEAKKESKVFS